VSWKAEKSVRRWLIRYYFETVEQIENISKDALFRILSYEAFLDNSVAQDVVEYNLFQMVNHLINIFQHTVVMRVWIPERLTKPQRFFSRKGFYLRGCNAF